MRTAHSIQNIKNGPSTGYLHIKGDTEEVWEPLFTYHGFRYVELSGLEKIDDQTIFGISINSLPEQTASFTSSDSRLNKLFECILWNQKSNYLDIPD